jgi:hypothetical protein
MRHVVRRRPMTLVLLMLACGAFSLAGAGASLARFTDAQADGGNAMAASYWIYYLHNSPTPPTGNTTAQANLTATTTASTQATLYNYDTNCDNRTGRLLTRLNPPAPGNTTVCRYVNWRLPARTTALTLAAGSTVTADVWSATNAAQANRTGSLIAYLRDYNPGSGTYVEIANATYTGTYAAGRTFYERPIAITLAGAYTLAVGHQLELKLESPRATSQNNMMVAYDTTGYRSYLRLR